LTTLNLSRTEITHEGAQHLSDILQSNQVTFIHYFVLMIDFENICSIRHWLHLNSKGMRSVFKVHNT